MGQQVVRSGLNRLDWRDVLHGFIVAAGTAFFATGAQMIEGWMNNPNFAIDKVSLILSLKAAFAAGVVYLIKRFRTPTQIVTTIKALALFLCIGFMSSCNFTRDVLAHNKVEVVKAPKYPDDTISIVWKFWGAQDLVNQYFPGNSKLAVFLRESTKHCNVNIVRVPKNVNDTIAVKLTCDSSLTTFKGWLPKKK